MGIFGIKGSKKVIVNHMKFKMYFATVTIDY